MKKSWSLVLILLFISMVGCSSKTDEEIIVGFSMGSMVLDRWQKDRDIFKENVESFGAKVIIKYANDKMEKQEQDIKEFIREGVDVIVIIPHDKDNLKKVIKKAKRKGIKIISYDRKINSPDIDLHITFDTEKVGVLMANALLLKKKKGNIILINGSANDDNSYKYNKGITDTLKQYVDSGELKIIKEVWARGWREKDSYDAVTTVIDGNRKIDGIIAGNDRLAEAAIQALSENKLAGEIPVIGHDGDLSAYQRIVEGTQTATVYKSFKKLAETAAEYAVKLAKGEKVDGKLIRIDDVYMVNKDNIRRVVIDNNIYEYNEIYVNEEIIK